MELIFKEHFIQWLQNTHFFNSTHRSFISIEDTLGHKANAITFEIRTKKFIQNHTLTWKLSNLLLNDSWVNHDIKAEIKKFKKFFESNENKGTTYQSFWDAASQVVLREMYSTKCSHREVRTRDSCGDSLLYSQHFGRLRWVDHLRSRVRDQPGQHSKNSVSTKNTKISQAWWHSPVIPATQEAKAESLEPNRWRLQWTEIMPLHSSLGDRARLRLKKRKKKCG